MLDARYYDSGFNVRVWKKVVEHGLPLSQVLPAHLVFRWRYINTGKIPFTLIIRLLKKSEEGL